MGYRTEPDPIACLKKNSIKKDARDSDARAAETKQIMQAQTQKGKIQRVSIGESVQFGGPFGREAKTHYY